MVRQHAIKVHWNYHTRKKTRHEGRVIFSRQEKSV